MSASPLDQAVLTALDALRALPSPDVLVLAGTGVGALPERLAHQHGDGGSLDLAGTPGLPDLWARQVLFHGQVPTDHGPATWWLLEDEALDAPVQPHEAPWERGFACWLAARAGASVVLHSAAGAALGGGLEPGDLALVRDHVNLSGSTPLLGLGGSKLGPLFPDVSRLHHEGLRSGLIRLAAARGIDAREAVVAATAPASLPTPAERAWFATAGADAWVAGAAAPWLAAAHAGLGLASLVAVTGSEATETEVPAILEASGRAAPALEELLIEGLTLAATTARAPQA